MITEQIQQGTSNSAVDDKEYGLVEAAVILGRSYWTVRNWFLENKISGNRRGKRIFISGSELESIRRRCRVSL